MDKQIIEPSGILVVDKHAGVTSHDIVYKVRKAYNTMRVGHTGTLDPMATGVLVVLVGRAAKAAEYIGADKKHYSACLRLGITTDTEDITGKVLTSTDELPESDKVIDTVRSMLGRSMQLPPMYSAIKIGGKKLYELARAGETVEREPRPIEIFSIDCKQINACDYRLDVVCSAGTYIRTLCADIGNKLICGGVMADLRRLGAGDFSIDASHTIDEINSLTYEERLGLLLPTESLFTEFDLIRLSDFFEKLFRSGCKISQKKLKVSYPAGTYLRIADANGHFFALGKSVVGDDGALSVKSEKLFEL